MAKRGRPDIDVTLIVDEMKKYTREVQEKIIKAANKRGLEAKKKLIATSPRSNKNHKHYADQWAISKEQEDGRITLTIHNRVKPGLTHLLEYGHLDRNGKRVKAITHIEPVQTKLNDDFYKDCEEILNGKD